MSTPFANSAAALPLNLSQLFASGLLRTPPRGSAARSQLLSFTGFLTQEFQQRSVVLPEQHESEIAREGMAIGGGWVYFLPDDLGASNRVLRVPLADLMSDGPPLPAPASDGPRVP